MLAKDSIVIALAKLEPTQAKYIIIIKSIRNGPFLLFEK